MIDKKIKAVHLLYESYLSIEREAKRANPYETGGFLAGYVAYWNNEYHIVVEGEIPSNAKGTEVTVQLLNDNLEEFAKVTRELRERGLYIVGWWHSHPGYTCMPSTTDIGSHTTYFREFYHIGLIIDPVNDDLCCFQARRIVKNNKIMAIYNMLPIYVWRKKI